MTKRKSIIKFRDALILKPQVKEEDRVKLKDFYSQNSSSPIRITIAATHAGKITRNNGFYLPHKMKKGAASFTSNYTKPVQVHHNDMQDPIGRIKEARYVDLSQGLRNVWDSKGLKDSKRPISDNLLTALCEGKLSLKESVPIIRDLFIKDASIVNDPDYEGLGYVEITAEITDPDAIQKVLDGRYLTGSVGASTDAAVCSICNTDWADSEGPCEHRPGKIYDDAKCVLIAGDLEYEEYSFVNAPADVHSRVIGIVKDGVETTISLDNNTDIPEINFSVVKDSVNPREENLMLFKQALDRLSKLDFFKEVEDLHDAIKSVLDNKEISNEDKQQNLEKLVADKLGKLNEYEETLKDKSKDSVDNTDLVKDFFKDKYEEIVGEDSWGHHYAQMMHSLLDEVEDDKKDEVMQQIKDATLSAEQRKNLPASAFCGPDRSFPVPDCAHVTAARRLIGRYEGPGDKAEILACVDKKAKSLGCDENEDSKKKTEGITSEFLDSLSNESLEKIADTLNEVLKEREIECKSCKEMKSKLEDLELKNKELKEKVQDTDKLQELEDKVEGLEKKLVTARKEAKYLHEDIENLHDALVKSEQKNRESKVEKIKEMKILSGEELEDNFQEELKKKSSAQLDEMIKDFDKKVDIAKIADTLKSGISNTPNESVSDPTLKHKENKTQVSKETLNWVAEQYTKIRMSHGQYKANQFLDQCKFSGIIPKQYPVQD